MFGIFSVRNKSLSYIRINMVRQLQLLYHTMKRFINYLMAFFKHTHIQQSVQTYCPVRTFILRKNKTFLETIIENQAKFLVRF